jgi:hypothetical protein
LNLIQAMNETRVLFSTGQAVLWSSGSGIGKSQGAWQLFQKMKADGEAKGERWGCGIIFGATHTPPDVLGYMFKAERDIVVGIDAEGAPITKKFTVTDPTMPLWMISTEGKPASTYDRFFLIIDEYGQTDPETKKPLAEVLLNGGTSPWYLPHGSVRLALTNEGARYGVSKDFDFCIARRTKIEIHQDVDVLLQHLDKPYSHQGRQWTTMPVIKAWANANPTIVFEPEPPQQGPWCNPRQLCAYDRYLQTKFEITGNQEVDGQSLEVGAGTIGMAATASIAAHLQFRLQLPSYDDVVADPAGADVPTRADLQMLMAYELAGHSKTADLAALIQYVNRLPKDMGVTYISALLRRDYKGMINTPAMQAWINKNASLVAIIASLSN